MTKTLFATAAILAMLVGLKAQAALPTLVLKNNFGEQTSNFVVGGSSSIDISFIVDSANGNGLGVRSVKTSSTSPQNAVANVFMHTSATPASGNPNPASGYIVVQLAKAFSGYVNGFSGFVSPLSGTPINVTSALTVGNPYTIASPGTTTQAQYVSLGLAPGVVPAAGASFIAISATPVTGTGVVEAPKSSGSGASHIELIGDPNATAGATAGAYILSQVMGASSAVAPSDGTVIGMHFVME